MEIDRVKRLSDILAKCSKYREVEIDPDVNCKNIISVPQNGSISDEQKLLASMFCDVLKRYERLDFYIPIELKDKDYTKDGTTNSTYTIRVYNLNTIKDRHDNVEICSNRPGGVTIMSSFNSDVGSKRVALALVAGSGIRNKFNIHTIVHWTIFGPSYHKDDTIDHIDGDNNNNHPTNLRWLDKSGQTVNRKSPSLPIPRIPYQQYLLDHPERINELFYEYRGCINKPYTPDATKSRILVPVNGGIVRFILKKRDEVVLIENTRTADRRPVVSVEGRHIQLQVVCIKAFLQGKITIGEDQVIRHIDDNVLNTRRDNLVLGSYTENAMDLLLNGGNDHTRSAPVAYFIQDELEMYFTSFVCLSAAQGARECTKFINNYNTKHNLPKMTFDISTASVINSYKLSKKFYNGYLVARLATEDEIAEERLVQLMNRNLVIKERHAIYETIDFEELYYKEVSK